MRDRALDFWHGLNTGMGDFSTRPKAGPGFIDTMTSSPRAIRSPPVLQSVRFVSSPNRTPTNVSSVAVD